MSKALPNGTILNDFQVHDELNRGGFSIIYEGSNRTSKIHVAIKEYLPEDLATRSTEGYYIDIKSHTQGDFRKGKTDFLYEAEILEQFNHPNIVRFHNKFEMHNTAYIVMELVQGKDLSAYRESEGGTLSEDKLKSILCPLLNALEAVHEAGYLHRDIKPGNIVLDENKSPKLLDFGAAKKMGENQKVTVTNGVLTDYYSPPEQHRQKSEQGPWTDIYALGAVCYEALMGILPPKGDERDGPQDWISPCYNVEGESTEFCKAIDKALKVEPSERPQNVKEWKEMMESPPPDPPGPVPDPPGPAPKPDEVLPTKRLPPPPKPWLERMVGLFLIAFLCVGAYNYLEVSELAELARFYGEVGRGPEPSGRFKGETDLHITARLGLLKLTIDLLNKGVVVDAKDNNGQTPLHLATERGSAEVVVALLNKGAAVGAKDNNGQTPLHLATERGSAEMVELLREWERKQWNQQLAKEEDTFVERVGRKPKPSGRFKGETDLHITVRLDLPRLTKRLLDKKADIDAKDNDGNTPLHLAVRENAAAAAAVLIKGEADVHAEDSYGRTLLHLAAMENAVAVAKVLIEGGASVDAKNNNDWTPLHYAALYGYPEVAKMLLDKKADIDAKDNDGNTPLHLAVRENAEEAAENAAVVEVLLEWGADVNAKSNTGETPLHLAQRRYSVEVIGLTGKDGSAYSIADVLLRKGADVNAKSNTGETPLHLAAGYGSDGMVKLLLKWGADVDAKNNDGKMPEDMATPDVIHILNFHRINLKKINKMR